MEVDVLETKRSLASSETQAPQLHDKAREQRGRDGREAEHEAPRQKTAGSADYLRQTEVVKTLRPGVNGTKKFLQQYGESLVAVRYRRDRQRKRQLTTIELVIDERDPPDPRFCRNGELSRQRVQMVSVKLDFDELDLRQAVKRCEARWDREKKVWWLKREDAVALRLLDRVVTGLEAPDLDFC